VSYAVRRPCSDFMDMLRRLINYRIIIIIIIIIIIKHTLKRIMQCAKTVLYIQIETTD